MMKYQIGDKVKIKTWEKMVSQYGEKYGENNYRSIIPSHEKHFVFSNRTEDEINEKNPDRILTIKEIVIDINHNDYRMKNYKMYISWKDWMIEGLVRNYKKPTPIINRFEILDL